MVSSHGEFEVVLGVLALGVLEAECEPSIVHQHGQLLVCGAEVFHEFPDGLQVRKVQLNTSPHV